MKSLYSQSLKRSFNPKLPALALAFLLALPGSRAQTAATWDFSNTLAGTPGANISAANVSVGSSIVSTAFNSGTEWYGQDGWTAASTPDMNGYIQFTVTASSGYYLVLNNLTMTLRRSNTGSSGGGPTSWSLRSSLDGYTTDLASSSLTMSYVGYPVTLGSAFQSIPSTVTFRLYGYNAVTSSGSFSRFVVDKISIQGQSNPGILAAHALDLTARATATNTVNLQWSAEGFAGGTRFAVERSTDGATFATIYEQTGNTPASQYQDGSLPSVSRLFYRMTATEPDGAVSHSPITSVSLAANSGNGTAIRGVAAQGNSVKAFLHLGESGAYQVTIWSQDGKALYRQSVNGPGGDLTADIILGSYPHGMYVLTLSKGGVNSSRQFMF